MLKKVEKHKKFNKEKPSKCKNNFSKFKKNLFSGKRFKNIRVPMREISLSDNDIKKLTVYDTSGIFLIPISTMIMNLV